MVSRVTSRGPARLQIRLRLMMRHQLSALRPVTCHSTNQPWNETLRRLRVRPVHTGAVLFSARAQIAWLQSGNDWMTPRARKSRSRRFKEQQEREGRGLTLLLFPWHRKYLHGVRGASSCCHFLQTLQRENKKTRYYIELIKVVFVLKNVLKWWWFMATQAICLAFLRRSLSPVHKWSLVPHVRHYAL